ncbi:uncharacterized protein [Battus philenor]|uniref:uncharacterized protein n=1 Tax=Battus philenor TaxID=42288 RepID=UPI0035D12878
MRKRKLSRPHVDLLEIINKVAEISNLRDIEFVIEVGCDNVDCFIGGLHVVRMRGMSDKFKIKRSFIVKWHPNPVERACFREAYLREIAYYKSAVPVLLDIQRRYKVIEGLRMKFPNCIFSSTERGKECVTVLIEHREYFFFDRLNKIDLNHAILVIKNLAKLHALSFTLAKVDPQKFNEIKDIFSKDVQYGDATVIPKSLITFFLASVAVVSDTDAKEKLMKLAPSIILVLNKCTSPIENYGTICHSDCWNNNLIFKYQNKKPVDSLLVDFQLSRYASPVTDLSYFFYMSTESSFLDKHYDSLINIYYGTLSAVLRQCDLFAEDIYPRGVFQKHLEDYSVYGLVEALISMKIITAESEEVTKLTEMKYNQPDELCQYELENQSLYTERVNGVVNHFFKKNYALYNVLSL